MISPWCDEINFCCVICIASDCVPDNDNITQTEAIVGQSDGQTSQLNQPLMLSRQAIRHLLKWHLGNHIQPNVTESCRCCFETTNTAYVNTLSLDFTCCNWRWQCSLCIWRSFHEVGSQNCPISQLVATVNEKLFFIHKVCPVRELNKFSVARFFLPCWRISVFIGSLGIGTAQFTKWAVSQSGRNTRTSATGFWVGHRTFFLDISAVTHSFYGWVTLSVSCAVYSLCGWCQNSLVLEWHWWMTWLRFPQFATVSVCLWVVIAVL